MVFGKYMTMLAFLGLTLAPVMDADAKRSNKAQGAEAPTEEVSPRSENPLERIYSNIETYISHFWIGNNFPEN